MITVDVLKLWKSQMAGEFRQETVCADYKVSEDNIMELSDVSSCLR